MNNLQIGSSVGDEIIDRLNAAGYDAYYVGGCVRNALLGIEIKDWDIASSAKPDEVKALFDDLKIVETGLKHGTVTIISDMPYEVTTFRKEGKYSDFRHPDRVYFCESIIEDLARRDFTCNAIAFSKNKGIIDVFGGIYDTHNHILRSVGIATTRFKEDSLRILRGIRFSSELGFVIEDKTFAAMIKTKTLIGNVSRERIYAELKRIFDGQYFYNAVINCREILSESLNTELPAENYSNAVLSSSKCKGDFYTKFTVFLYIEYEKNLSAIKEILVNLRCEKKLKKTLEQCLSCMEILSSKLFLFSGENSYGENNYSIEKKYIAKKILNECEGSPSDFLSFLDAIDIKDFSSDELKIVIKKVLSNNECYAVNQLAITGADIALNGFTGHRISKALNNVLDCVMSEKITNEKERLLDYVRSLKL